MCPSTHLEYYSATKRREALTLTITWTDPENTILSEKQTQKDTQGMIPLMRNIRNWQIHRHKEWAPGCQGMGGGALGGQGMFGGNGRFWNEQRWWLSNTVRRRPLNHSL